jgi:hypothetical protein
VSTGDRPENGAITTGFYQGYRIFGPLNAVPVTVPRCRFEFNSHARVTYTRSASHPEQAPDLPAQSKLPRSPIHANQRLTYRYIQDRLSNYQVSINHVLYLPICSRSRSTRNNTLGFPESCGAGNAPPPLHTRSGLRRLYIRYTTSCSGSVRTFGIKSLLDSRLLYLASAFPPTR